MPAGQGDGGGLLPNEASTGASRAKCTPSLSACENWTLYEYETVTSTNLVAARLPAWSAVRADLQTAGRGRFQRSWVSDRGGLWLSAVLPSGATPGWRALPLVVGLAVCRALQGLGVNRLRMRWPNDVLVADRKLAGLLLDQFFPGSVVAGIGINVRNNPAAADPALAGRVVTLAELIPQPPNLRALTRAVLTELRRVVEPMQDSGLSLLLPEINRLWGESREVELDLDGPLRRGRFAGVDEQGRLLLGTGPGAEAFFPHEVRHLTEL